MEQAMVKVRGDMETEEVVNELIILGFEIYQPKTILFLSELYTLPLLRLVLLV